MTESESLAKIADSLTLLVTEIQGLRKWLESCRRQDTAPRSEEPFEGSKTDAYERIDPSAPPSKPKHWSSQEEREEMQRECDKFTCPLCNGKMRARQARATGEWFMGCAAYPECTGTRHMDGQNSTRRKPAAKPNFDDEEEPPF